MIPHNGAYLLVKSVIGFTQHSPSTMLMGYAVAGNVLRIFSVLFFRTPTCTLGNG